ncbi:MAG TPA: GTPase ObgE, partial [Firmicutes bacterium]|nr:GTPase ObgE [Bacillota bacterium]
AKNGIKGRKSNMHGAKAENMIIEVPAGTVVKDKKTGKTIKDLAEDSDSLVIAKGGRGGRGNARFKSSTRQAPRFYEKGEPGEEREIILELKILADAGIIGMANAGKSTLLSKISNAKPKIGDYQFTTLHPNLGLVKIDDETSFVVADIPGLIEGAAQGKGLGIDFLRHIERTRAYVHIVDPTQGDPLKNYKIINAELDAYNEKLSRRPCIVAVNKCDIVSKEEQEIINESFKKEGLDVLFVSAKEGIGVENIKNKLYNIIKNIPKNEIAEKPTEITEEKNILEVKKKEEGVFELKNKRLEKYMAMLDFEYQETWEVFRKYMERSGVNVFLKEKGIKTGDIIIIGKQDFLYQEDEE